MEKNELRVIHSKLVDNIMNTLMMTGAKIRRGEGPIDFSWNGNNCHISTHKMVGGGTKYMVMEYCKNTSTDIQSPNEMQIFVDYENPSIFYKINTKVLYDTVNWGLENDRKNFHITNPQDVLKNAGLCISINFDTFRNMMGVEVFDMNAIRETLPTQYEPLVNKIVNQFFKKGIMEWDQLTSMAWEGFAIALNTFDINRSNMSFTQFAAFAIRNNILTCIDNELRTVKLSAYAQKKVQDRWGDAALFNTVSINTSPRDDEKIPQEMRFGMYTNAKFDDGDIYEHLCTRIEEEFPERDCKIFYKTFGLNGYNEMKGKDIAKEFNISEGLVSQKIKKITTWIRKDDAICEMLQNLF